MQYDMAVFVKLQRLASDDVTAESSSSLADNNDNTTSVDDGGLQTLINTDLTDTDTTTAAAAEDDDQYDDVVARNLQKRQSVTSDYSSISHATCHTVIWFLFGVLTLFGCVSERSFTL